MIVHNHEEVGFAITVVLNMDVFELSSEMVLWNCRQLRENMNLSQKTFALLFVFETICDMFQGNCLSSLDIFGFVDGTIFPRPHISDDLISFLDLSMRIASISF